MNAFEQNGIASPTVHILNAGGLQARGMGVILGRRFGDHVNGQVTYTYGRAWRSDASQAAAEIDATRFRSSRSARATSTTWSRAWRP